jgi:hypothetical protein
MLPATITSEELRRLTNYSKAQLVELEQGGIIERAAKNTWPIETVTKIVARLRERGQRPVDDDCSRFEASRAAREKLKLMKEAGEVCYTREFDEFALAVYPRTSSIMGRWQPGLGSAMLPCGGSPRRN